MAWTAPRTWVVGEIVTAALGNTHWRDNLRYLKGLDGAVTLSDALILPDGAGYYLHIPILTTTQRDALTPTAGMLIYNSTTTQFNKYENGAWRADLGFNSAHTNLSGLTSGDDHTQYQKEDLLTTAGDLPYATAASTWARLGIGTANQLLRTNSGATAPEWATISAATLVRKTADESIASSVTLQNDDELLFAIGANEVWEFTLILITYSASTVPDMKTQFALPSGATAYGWMIGLGADDVTFSATWVNSETNLAVVTAIRNYVQIQGVFINSSTAGNVQLQWAQRVSNATAVTVKANSYIVAHKLA